MSRDRAMNPDSRKAKAIFDRAVEIESPSDREAFVLRECAEDPGLRAKVLGLLGAYDQAGTFLESAPLCILTVATADHPPDAALGTIVGPHKLLEEVGEGGMAIVWMAQQQEPVKRLVAVKLIKAGMDSRQVIARFEAERQALALMDHANIARVLDAGATQNGRPYFVMDLVKG